MLISLHKASLSKLIKTEVKVSSLTVGAINLSQDRYKEPLKQLQDKNGGKAIEILEM